MSLNDRTIMLIVPLVAVVAGVWFMVISPKQGEVKELDAQVSTLRSEVAAQEQAAQEGLVARKDFPRDYHRLVVMGKAVPADDETASLLVQINRIAERSEISFRAITQSQGVSAAATPTPTAAPATESAAALLPIGATVGSAGLPTLPYELTFRGNYFEIADFMAGIDRLVNPRRGTVAADGRLVTVDGFTLTADENLSFPALKATMTVTTYVAPADQGATAGASPTGPAAIPAATAQPTSTTTPAPAPAAP